MQNHRSVGYIFIVLAAVVIVLFGIKTAAGIIVPFLLSVFIAIVFTPLVGWLTDRRVPHGLALMLVILLFMVLMGMMAGMIGSSVKDFTANLPQYDEKLEAQVQGAVALLEGWGLEVSKESIVGVFDPKVMMRYAALTLSSTMGMVANGLVILLTVIFIMLEAGQFEAKLLLIGGNEAALGQFRDIVGKIKAYMGLKALISAATGVLIAVLLALVGVDYPILWGTLAFMLNFIPNIGSLIAAVPAVLLALIQLDPLHALIVAAGYVVVNTLIGSVVEPKVMGRGLGLSTLVVFLSLIFWGALLGPVGMLLSIPLTIMVKIVLASQRNTRWIAVLLDSNDMPKEAG
jgi:predicted PurR-regulated permease PerM